METKNVNKAHLPIEQSTEKGIKMDYEPIPLPKLIGMSELIISGFITDNIDSCNTFQIEEILAGEYKKEMIKVHQFTPSKFDEPRQVPYALGQHYLLFLQKAIENDSTWSILGFGGEGEMPIQEEFVYFDGSFINGLESKPYQVLGKTRPVQRFDIKDFKNAVANYASCFEWQLKEEVKNNKKRERWIPINNCNDKSINDYQLKSWIHQYLVDQTIKKIPIRTNH